MAEGPMTDNPMNLDQLCAERGIDLKKLAELASLEESRVTAIVLGRWTPSPDERDSIAAVFGLSRDQIVWGHKTPIQHLYGQGPA
jgi:plasmid maintenance system antidote protein VapI